MDKVPFVNNIPKIFNQITEPLRKIGNVIVGNLSSVSRYILVCFLILIAAFSSWILSIPPSKPNLLAPVLSLAWWLNPLERGAVLRLPIINVDTEPVAYSIEKDEFYISFIDPAINRMNFIYINNNGDIHSSGKEHYRMEDINKSRIPEEQTIYFAYDSSDLNPAAMNQVNKLAKEMAKFPEYWIDLSGHTGKKESIEYNLALGERLARSVKKALVAAGVEGDRISTISYGEERPKYLDLKDEQKNYRVETRFAGEGINRFQNEPNPEKENANAEINWKSIPMETISDDANDLIKINESWSLSNDKGLILSNHNGQGWMPVVVTKKYAEGYLKKREPAFEFNFKDNKFQWRKKETLREGASSKTLESLNTSSSASSTEWSKEDFHRTYPAPLAYIIIGILGLMVLIVISVKEISDPVNSNNIVEHFASDAPISIASRDCLGFNRIARSISQFLRNEKTTPPLTIAVTGQWGCGKSSLMQLLASDLKEHRIRPVWLNAWHHQNESQFLYGLLNAIRSQGIPSIFSGAHLLFRMKLLISRIKHEPFYALILAALLAIPIGFLSAVEKGSLPTNWFTVWLAKENWAMLATTALPFLWGLSNLSGEKLTKLAAGKFKQRLMRLTSSKIDLQSAAGLRDQFVREFRHLCNAVGISTLTVFIDDLDRCSEKRVMDVLETVNFLVSSGKCIVVFGMDREPVERAIGNYYGASYKDAEGEELIHFARRYLEKLVNIEVPVPVAKGEKTIDLVAPKSKEKIRPMRFLKSSISILLLIIFFSFSLYFGAEFGKIVSKIDVESNVALPASRDKRPGDANETVDKTGTAPFDGVSIIKEQESKKANHTYTFGPLIFLFVLAGFLTFENHRHRRRVLVFDSEDFTHAIHDWILLMGHRNSTPRRIKRFVNRARFLTMRLRNDRESGITENDLVTMTGLHELDPNLLEIIEKGEKTELKNELDRLIPNNDTETITKMVGQCNTFYNTKTITVFKSWVLGIDVR